MPWMTGQQYLDANPDVKKAGVDPLYHVLTYVLHGRKEPRPLWIDPAEPPKPPDPPPGPTPPDPPVSGEITDFQRVKSADNPGAIYFSSGKVAGKMRYGEYRCYSARLYREPHSLETQFTAESVFDICAFKGSWYCSLEHGGYPDIDRGMVMKWNGSKWVEVFRHPSWILAFHLHVHGDKLYVSGSNWNPMTGGIWRTADGTHWEEYVSSNYVYWDMASGGNDLWTAGAYGGDYGPGCHPVVFRNRDLVWESSEQGAGFLGIAAAYGDIFLGQATPAKVVRFSDKKTVLSMPTQNKVPKLIVDEACNTLYAIGCRTDEATSGAEVWKTKDGSKWSLARPPFSIPHLFHAYQDPDDKSIWLAGGKFNAYGRIYKSIRG